MLKLFRTYNGSLNNYCPRKGNSAQNYVQRNSDLIDFMYNDYSKVVENASSRFKNVKKRVSSEK